MILWEGPGLQQSHSLLIIFTEFMIKRYVLLSLDFFIDFLYIFFLLIFFGLHFFLGSLDKGEGRG